MTILDQISLIAQGVDPSTGELFDISILNSDPEIRKAIQVLNSVLSRKSEPQNSIPIRNSEIEISEIAERLRALRRDIAAAAAFSSYCIFTGKTFGQLAAFHITSKPQLLSATPRLKMLRNLLECYLLCLPLPSSTSQPNKPKKGTTLSGGSFFQRLRLAL